MVKRNAHLAKLEKGYLFPEINKRKNQFLKENPTANIISLGIGDTTKPLSEEIVDHIKHFAISLSTKEGYSGYGPEQGQPELRKKIAETFYNGKISPDEIFISDGAKCDIGRLQVMFGPDVTIAVQDPTYPVYVDTGVILGQTGTYHKEKNHYSGITYMKCAPENDFFPDLETLARTDLIYFCSPNNPTGSVATKDQLTQLVQFAKKNHSIIIFDAAYSEFIQDKALPKSIYEIEGAKEVAIEVNSFSKMAGFTGLRLGWSVVPDALLFEDGFSVKKDWDRMNSTFFNGASNIVQKSGLKVLELKNEAIDPMVHYYMENASLIRSLFLKFKFPVYGGIHAPFIWVKFQKKSWDAFDELLNQAHVVTTPGAGFGPQGENFLRFSSFGQRDKVIEAIERLNTLFSNTQELV